MKVERTFVLHNVNAPATWGSTPVVHEALVAQHIYYKTSFFLLRERLFLCLCKRVPQLLLLVRHLPAPAFSEQLWALRGLLQGGLVPFVVLEVLHTPDTLSK